MHHRVDEKTQKWPTTLKVERYHCEGLKVFKSNINLFVLCVCVHAYLTFYLSKLEYKMGASFDLVQQGFTCSLYV